MKTRARSRTASKFASARERSASAWSRASTAACSRRSASWRSPFASAYLAASATVNPSVSTASAPMNPAGTRFRRIVLVSRYHPLSRLASIGSPPRYRRTSRASSPAVWYRRSRSFASALSTIVSTSSFTPRSISPGRSGSVCAMWCITSRMVPATG